MNDPSAPPVTTDTVRKNRVIQGIRFTVVRYLPGTERIRSQCPDGQFWLMLRGGWKTRIVGGQASDCEPFSLSYHIPGEKNRRSVGSAGALLFGIQIPNRLLSTTPALRCPMTPVFQATGDANRIALKLFHAIASGNDADDLVGEELLAALTAAASGQIASAVGREPRWTSRVRDILHARHTEPLTLQEIAAAGEIHPVYLSTAFRQRFGCGIGDYLRRLRLETALSRLCRTEDEMSIIARDAGFYDQAHFIRVFKAQMGVAPGALRRSLIVAAS